MNPSSSIWKNRIANENETYFPFLISAMRSLMMDMTLRPRLRAMSWASSTILAAWFANSASSGIGLFNFSYCQLKNRTASFSSCCRIKPTYQISNLGQATVKKLNVEHRTSNIEHRILMTLRFIDFKTSEPQNPPKADKFRRVDPLAQRRRLRRVLLSLFLNRPFDTKAHDRPFDTKAHDRQNTLFDVRRSMLMVS